MIELQRLTGTRPGGAGLMRTCDVETSGSVWVCTPSAHKTERHDRDRKVYLGPRAPAVVKPRLLTDLTSYPLSPAEAVETVHHQQP